MINEQSFALNPIRRWLHLQCINEWQWIRNLNSWRRELQSSEAGRLGSSSWKEEESRQMSYKNHRYKHVLGKWEEWEGWNWRVKYKNITTYNNNYHLTCVSLIKLSFLNNRILTHAHGVSQRKSSTKELEYLSLIYITYVRSHLPKMSNQIKFWDLLKINFLPLEKNTKPSKVQRVWMDSSLVREGIKWDLVKYSASCNIGSRNLHLEDLSLMYLVFQVIEMSGVCAASDIWSVGCTVIELLTCVPPYYDLQPMPALFRIVQVSFSYAMSFCLYVWGRWG